MVTLTIVAALALAYLIFSIVWTLDDISKHIQFIRKELEKKK